MEQKLHTQRLLWGRNGLIALCSKSLLTVGNGLYRRVRKQIVRRQRTFRPVAKGR